MAGSSVIALRVLCEWEVSKQSWKPKPGIDESRRAASQRRAAQRGAQHQMAPARSTWRLPPPSPRCPPPGHADPRICGSIIPATCPPRRAAPLGPECGGAGGAGRPRAAWEDGDVSPGPCGGGPARGGGHDVETPTNQVHGRCMVALANLLNKIFSHAHSENETPVLGSSYLVWLWTQTEGSRFLGYSSR